MRLPSVLVIPGAVLLTAGLSACSISAPTPAATSSSSSTSAATTAAASPTPSTPTSSPPRTAAPGEYEAMIQKQAGTISPTIASLLGPTCRLTHPGDIETAGAAINCQAAIATVGSQASNIQILIDSAAGAGVTAIGQPPSTLAAQVAQTRASAVAVVQTSAKALPCASANAPTCAHDLATFKASLIILQADLNEWVHPTVTAAPPVTASPSTPVTASTSSAPPAS